MPHKWYLLSLTGSLTRCNTYMRKYTNHSDRGGVLIGNAKRIDSITKSKTSSVVSIKKKRKTRTEKISISNGKRQNNLNENCYTNSKSIVKDIPQMREFFEEVRKRELVRYYQQMVRKQRLEAKPNPTQESENVYCTGPTRISSYP
ncbi:uncharacterized protein Dwil_GK28185 [Drosophila willistoni]|uniref:Uncharacterized protein n=1 Tax=Drosophila willistoni TaxID=7260 RepID=A0A0Q9WYS9_DROWI|nr:uncharacterized protein LOC26530187 [Drosophila willistoni]KRF97564.1 uncharacterized protein Dwil_GK28185 [Drosophila willistoni]